MSILTGIKRLLGRGPLPAHLYPELLLGEGSYIVRIYDRASGFHRELRGKGGKADAQKAADRVMRRMG